MSITNGYNRYARTGNFAVIGNFATNVRDIDEAELLSGEPQPLSLPPECFVFAAEDFARRHHSHLTHIFDDSCTVPCDPNVFRQLRMEFPANLFSLAFIDASNLDYMVAAEELWAANLPVSKPTREISSALMYS